MPWHEVIGVVQDVAKTVWTQAAPPTVDRLMMSASLNARPGRPNAIRGVSFIVRSDRPLTTGLLLNQIQQAVWSVNPGLPASPRTMREVYDQSLARTSFTLVMLAIAASMALLLGVVGIYGVIAYVVSQRRREIGIRAALGAQRGELRWMFVRHGLALAGIGIVVGLAAAATLTRADVDAVVRDHAARSLHRRRGGGGANNHDGARGAMCLRAVPHLSIRLKR